MNLDGKKDGADSAAAQNKNFSSINAINMN
jgi:hypothetical protein